MPNSKIAFELVSLRCLEGSFVRTLCYYLLPLLITEGSFLLQNSTDRGRW